MVSMFLKRHKLSSGREFGNECFISQGILEVHRTALHKRIELLPIEEIVNKDEVAVFYLFLPSRHINENTGTSSFISVKDRMKFVLTVFANSYMDPLSVLRKSKSPRSFPRHLNEGRDLGFFY